VTDLPDGWEWTTLADLAADVPRAITDGPFGSNLKSAHYVDKGPRVIRLQNIGFGDFVDAEAHITEEHFATLRAHEVLAGDLVVASLGEDLPRSCIVPEHVGPAIVKADCIRVRLSGSVDRRYVNYALQRPTLRAAVREQIHGVGRPRLGMAGIKALTVPVPPLDEQQRIVAAIEEHLSRVNAGVASLDVVDRKVDRLDAGLLERLHAGRWPGVTLGDLCETGRRFAYGVLQPGPDVREGVPMVRVGDIAQNVIQPDLKRIAPAIAEKYPRTALRGGEVLVSLVGSIGRTAVVPPELRGANVARAIAVLPLQPDADPTFVALALSSPRMRRRLESLSHEVARKTLNLEDVRRFPIHLPPIAEQRSIVESVLERRELSHRVGAAVEAGRRRAHHLRRSILAAAFAGRLA
jgi:type I restriction enzyme S subunit